MAPKFTWNNDAQRFRYASGSKNGQFVSKKTVRSLMEEFIEAQKKQSDRVVANLLNGGITLKEWEAGMARRIKATHSTAYLIGKGGTLRYDSAIDRGRIGGIVKREYQYLRKFSNQIAAGELTPAQIRARTRLYMNSIYGTEQYAEEYGHKDEDYQWEENIVSVGESCPDCVAYGNLGVVKIGTIPPVGIGRQCQSNCRCYKKFYKEKPENSGLLIPSWGWCGDTVQNNLVSFE